MESRAFACCDVERLSPGFRIAVLYVTSHSTSCSYLQHTYHLSELYIPHNTFHQATIKCSTQSTMSFLLPIAGLLGFKTRGISKGEYLEIVMTIPNAFTDLTQGSIAAG